MRWSRHVLHTLKYRLPRHVVMLSGVVVDCEEDRRGETATWNQSMKTVTIGLSQVNRCRLLGCDPRDYRNQCLETFGKIAQNRLQ